MSLREKMTALAEIIREKSGRTEQLSIDGMTAAVEEIVDYGEPLNTLERRDAEVHQQLNWDGSTPNIRLQAAVGGEIGAAAVDADTVVSLFASVEKFGTASAADVVSGKTCTSASGFLIKGTRNPMVMDMGFADLADISTKLSFISGMVLYRKSADTAGMVCAVYSGGSTWCVSSSGDGACTVGTGAFCETNEGTLRWLGTEDAAMAESVTYSWYAWGEA